MTVLPVVVREMSVMARRKSTYWSRAVTGGLALIVMLWLLLVSRAHVSYAQTGASIFFVLSSICFAFTVLAGMQATSDSVSEEKREGTLGLLFLTDLKSFDVIGGKLAANSLGVVLGLMGVVPILSLALLLGGVTFKQFGLVALVLGNTLFFSLALGVFVSTISENERKAMMGTFGALLIAVIGPFAISFLLDGRLGIGEEIVAASPLFAFSVLHQNPAFGTVLPPHFWASVALTHVLGWGLLLLAALILPRYANAVPVKKFSRIRSFAEEVVFGDFRARRKHRTELLDRNAFLWLASRERVKPKYAWGMIAFFVAMYFWVAVQFPTMMFDVAVLASIIVPIHAVFKIWTASEVCSRLIQDRRSGALELLLSTPLSVKEIADGQSKALARVFRKPIVLLIGLELLLFWSGSRWTVDWASRQEKAFVFLGAISTFLLDLWALKWVGLWLSLSAKSIERVLLATLLRILILPWIIFAALPGSMGSVLIFQRRGPDETEVLASWWVISVVVSIWFGVTSRSRFLAQFRELASRQFDSVAEAGSPINQPARPKVRSAPFYRRHPVTACLFAIMGALFLAGWIRGWYWERKAQAEFEKIRAAGFPVTLQEMLRLAPNLPASENAFAMLQNAGPLNLGRRAFIITAGNVHSPDVQQFLAFNKASLRGMWRLPEYSRGSFDVTLDMWSQQLQHTQVAGFITLAEADLFDAMEQDGEPDLSRVQKDLCALLAYARLLRDQPLGLAQQNAASAVQRIAAALGSVFESDGLKEEELLVLQREAERIGRTNILPRVIAIQRAQMLQFGGNRFAVLRMGMPLPQTLLMLDSFNSAIGSRDRNIVEIARHYENGMRLLDQPVHKRLAATSAMDAAPEANWMGMPMFRGAISQAVMCDASFIAHLNLIRAGIAAERYERKHGEPPRNLGALVPEFLPAVPEDPYTGEPLRTIFTDHLVIYSVGVDGQDNTANGTFSRRQTDLRLPVK